MWSLGVIFILPCNLIDVIGHAVNYICGSVKNVQVKHVEDDIDLAVFRSSDTFFDG